MRTLFRAALLAGLAAAGTACTTMRADTPVERPALEVPPPPPRIIVPLPKPPEPLEPVAALGPGPLVTPRPRPQRDNKEKDAAAKPEAKPEEPKPVEPPPPAPVAPPAPQLRMPETANSAQVARQIGEAIGRARALLDKVDYRRLSTVATKAYEECKVFAQQAEDELKANNLILAKELADKAERLAEGLQGR